MPTCLYCRATKDSTLFNREHVVPESFGRFRGNFVLKNVICRDCNDYFGRTLDLKLARETVEGLDRYKIGAKSPAQGTRFGLSDTLTARISDGGFHHGARVFWGPSSDQSRLVLLPFPQYGVSDGRETTWFTADALPRREGLSRHGFDLEREITVKPFGIDEDAARAQLGSLGYNTSLERVGETTEGSEINIRLNGSIDRTLRRAVAKIAYNYLAFQYQRIATMEQFTVLRRYVRYDEFLGPEPVTLSNGPLIAGTTPEKAPMAHVVAVENNGDQILGHVTLFFHFRYLVVLADGGFLIKPTMVNQGHIFNADTLEIYQLTSDARRGRPLTPPD